MRAILNWVGPAWVAALLLAAVGAASAAPWSGTARASVTHGGINVVVSLSRSTYPRNGLVVAHLHVRNVSSHAIAIDTTCIGGMGGYFPVVANVLGRTGRVLFPPAVPGDQAESCPPRAQRLLPPGQSIVRTQYVILRGSRLQANVLVARPSGAVAPVVATLHLRLGPSDPPSISLHRAPALSADIRPVAPAPLVITQWVRCAPASGKGSSVIAGGWERTARRHITPTCLNAVAWQLAVGQVGHSVREIDYIASSPGRRLK